MNNRLASPWWLIDKISDMIRITLSNYDQDKPVIVKSQYRSTVFGALFEEKRFVDSQIPLRTSLSYEYNHLNRMINTVAHNSPFDNGTPSR